MESIGGEFSKKKEAFIAHYISARGNISIACTSAGITRTTFYEWKKTDSAFAQRVEDADEAVLDIAETIVQQAINGYEDEEVHVEYNGEGKVKKKKVIKRKVLPDANLALKFLEAKGKSRGYGKQIDVTSGGKVIQSPFVIVKIEEDNEDD